MTVDDQESDADDTTTGTPEEDTLGRNATHNPTTHETPTHEDEERQSQNVGGISWGEPFHTSGEVNEVTIDTYLTNFVRQQGTQSEEECAVVEKLTKVGKA